MTEQEKYEFVYGVVYSNAQLRTTEDAQHVLNELLSLEPEWRTYYQKMGGAYRELFADIHNVIAQAYVILGKTDDAIGALNGCISTLERSDFYEYKFVVKSNVYEHLARIYSDNNADDAAKRCLRESIYNLLRGYNHTHYQNRDFFSFREVTEYMLQSLREDNITVTDPAEFNDPIDPLLRAHFDFQIQDCIENRRRKDAHFLGLLREIYGEVRIRCFTRMLPLEKVEGRDVSPLNAEEREINISTMWAHYAKYHKGICIKYVLPKEITDNLVDEDSVRMLGAVEYRKSFDPNQDTYNVHDAFFVKSNEWAYENEARLVYFNRHNQVKFAKIDIPSECVEAIYLGLRISEEDKLKVFEAIANKPHIKVYQMVLSRNNSFLFVPNEIERPVIEKQEDEKKGCFPLLGLLKHRE